LLDLVLLSLQLSFEFFKLSFVLDLNDLLDLLNSLESFDAKLRRINSRVDLTQLFSESDDLILEFSKHSIFRIFIDSRLVLNPFCSGSPSKGVDGFFHIVVGRTDVRAHDCLGVTTQ